jgi:endonuclease III
MLEVMDRLERFYGLVPLPPEDPFALYVWEVLGIRTTAARRDAAMNALRRIPALTPDSIGTAPRAKLEQAVALAGPSREERLRALSSGVDVFKRNRDLPKRLRGDIDAAKEALALLPHLTAISGQWLLLFAGGHPLLPDDPHVGRVLTRLGSDADSATEQLGRVVTAMQRATLYLSHHGRATCVDADPLCHICPLRSLCPFPCLRSEPPKPASARQARRRRKPSGLRRRGKPD